MARSWIVSTAAGALAVLAAINNGCRPDSGAPTEDTAPPPVPAPELPASENLPAEQPPLPESTPVDDDENLADDADGAATMDWQVVPGERVGPITAVTTEAELIAAYGEAHVIDDEYHVGEGETTPCTTIFPSDATKRIQVLWDDPQTKSRPSAVWIQGAGSQWRTADGLGIGTPLTQVETLNGGPFRLLGFGWDYSGRTLGFEGGTLATPEGALRLDFAPDNENSPEDVLREVTGDGDFRSDHPAMRALDPKVEAMYVGLGPGAS